MFFESLHPLSIIATLTVDYFSYVYMQNTCTNSYNLIIHSHRNMSHSSDHVNEALFLLFVESNQWLSVVMLIDLMSVTLMMWRSALRTPYLADKEVSYCKCCPRSLNLQRRFNKRGMRASSWSIAMYCMWKCSLVQRKRIRACAYSLCLWMQNIMSFGRI